MGIISREITLSITIYTKERANNSVRPFFFGIYQEGSLPSKTTYAPKTVDVHTFSKELKDVTEKTNIRQFCVCRRLESMVWCLINTYA